MDLRKNPKSPRRTRAVKIDRLSNDRIASTDGAPKKIPTALTEKLSVLNQLGSFSMELLQLRDPEAIRTLVARTVGAVLGSENTHVFFSIEETTEEAVRSIFMLPNGASNTLVRNRVAGDAECAVAARGSTGVLAVIRASDKIDWSPFNLDDVSILEAIAVQLGLRLENIRLEGKLLRHQESSIQALAAAIEVKDRYTSGHTKRVGIYADALAQHLPISNSEKEKIRLAGVLHDIGKIGVPDRILLKPGSLTGDEWDEMRLHTEAGFDIVSRVLGLEEIAEILRHHHERWDGTGYPRGLRGEAIPLASRVIAIADTFDAIVTDRPYRAALSPAEAREIILLLAGTHFDPEVVTAFLEAFPKLEACVSAK